MPTIAGNCVSTLEESRVEIEEEMVDVRSEKSSPIKKRRSTSGAPISPPSPMKWKSPRRCFNSTPSNGIQKDSADNVLKSHKSSAKRLSDSFVVESKWNPRLSEQMRAVKEVLHVSMAPSTLVCREDEQNMVLNFCKTCVESEKAGSLYVCGCPGTGKSLSIEKVKQLLLNWAGETGLQPPDVLSITCTSLTNTFEIFSKILGNQLPQKKINGSISPLQSLQKLYSQKQQSSGMKMTLIIADEMDYLITKDRAVLHDLFMLTTFPFSRCILIGIANAIDLADRFLPKLQSLNCKPMVITFRAYSKDQILKILHQRLMVLPYTVFQSQALELCAKKVAAASGDMRKALCVCRSAIEMLENELRESASHVNLSPVENGVYDQQTTPAHDFLTKQEIDTVRVDHMVLACSKIYTSPIVDTIQSLPQHQQILLCSAVKFFRGTKKDTTVGELNKSYLDICKLLSIPPAGIFEFSSMCRVLSDQGILKLGKSRDDKLKRVTLNVDEADIAFALQGVRFFRNCLQ